MDSNFQMPPTPSAPKQGNGSTAAIIIVLLIVALAGAYFWISRSNTSPSQAEEVQSIDSDDSTLEQELNAAGDVNLEADLESMDQEFK